MYTEFYHLKEKPFNLTPSSRFLYLSENHKEALALLSYGIMERKGFILLTGEVGTGKTTIIQALLANLEKNVQYVHMTNPMVSSEDFIHYLASSAFKKKVHFRSKGEFLLEFEEYLRVCMQHQESFLLIIDEAQNLSFKVLEEIRLLSNMESGDEKLINIFLVGQPELNEILSEPRCRALLQRIACRFQIPPLNREETGNYINTRLKVAGARNGNQIFKKGAIISLYEYSGGNPRIINILADNAMLLGYSKGKRKISADLVKQSSDELLLRRASDSFESEQNQAYRKAEGAPVPRKRKSNKWRLVVFLMILAIIVAAWSLREKGKDFFPSSEVVVGDGIESPPPGGAASGSNRGVIPQSLPQEELGDKEGRVVLIPEEGPADALRKEEKVETPHKGFQIPSGATQELARQGQEKASDLVTIRVREGDTLAILAVDFYGRADKPILDLIQKYNPELSDLNRIRVGQELIFPPLEDALRSQQTFTVHVGSFYTFNQALELSHSLSGEGYEVHILPDYDSKGDKFFRVAVESFENQQSAKAFASSLLRKGVSDHTDVILLEMK